MQLGDNIFFTSKQPRDRSGDKIDCGFTSALWPDTACNGLRSFPESIKIELFRDEIVNGSKKKIQIIDPVYHDMANSRPWTEE